MPSEPPPPNNSDPAHWFADEVQPHTPALRAYLNNAFPAVRSDLDDVVQDSLLRVWLAYAKQPIQSARGLLFKIARHRAIDALRRSKLSPINAVEDIEALPHPTTRDTESAAVGREEKSQLLAQAIDALPRRCREVVILRKLRSLPQREVAQRLGISEKTVEAQLARGIKRVETWLRHRGVQHYYDYD